MQLVYKHQILPIIIIAAPLVDILLLAFIVSMKAFNQNSYHNLYDIWEFAKTNFSSFFKEDSNPCSACHNVHLAKRNKEHKSDPYI
ncbi:MAG: hypothetical protein KCCBMMGE_02103 [Candidatus Methanoperedenaceae archaeon GB37]|nr:MAG: hypothetical protein KCCBMMGE_02103 [Candidatus Methanoperedenaceae archaeon GB37]